MLLIRVFVRLSPYAQRVTLSIVTVPPPVLDPPETLPTLEEWRIARAGGRDGCHLLRGDAILLTTEALCGVHSAWGILPKGSERDVDGHCIYCGRLRCRRCKALYEEGVR